MWKLDWGCAIPRKGIHKRDFPCSVQLLRRTKYRNLPCHIDGSVNFITYSENVFGTVWKISIWNFFINSLHACYRIFCIYFSGIDFVGYSFAYIVHLWFWQGVWNRTQIAAACRSKQASPLALCFVTNSLYVAAHCPSLISSSMWSS
jgi:hypothetical protein